MEQADPIRVANQAFSDILEAFPSLQVLHESNAEVELSLVLPSQAGLKYQVWLGFQNEDELHFSVSNFWLECFPCTTPAKAKAYVSAVCGFLSGNHRVVEHFILGKCVKAQLQEPTIQSWRTIGTWSRPLGLLPLPHTLREVRNA